MTQVNPLVGDALIAASVRRRLTDMQTATIQTPGGKYGHQAIDLGMFVPHDFDAFCESFAGGLNMTTHLIKRGWVRADQCFGADICVPLMDYHRAVVSPVCETLVRDLLAMEACHGRGNRDLFVQALEDIASSDEYRRARGFYVHNVMSHNGVRIFDRPSLYSAIRTREKGLRRSHILRLPLFGALLHGMHLLTGDYEICVQQALQFSANTFCAFDPPYPRPDAPHRQGFDLTLYGAEFDHDRFVRVAKDIANKAAIMITLNDIAENRRDFAGFNVMSRPVHYGASRRHCRELVILNYTPPRQDDHMARLGWERISTTIVAVVGLRAARTKRIKMQAMPTTSRQDAVIGAIRQANLANGRANRLPTPKIIRVAEHAAERVNEMVEELPLADRYPFRFPDAADRCVSAYSVEYSRYFPECIPLDASPNGEQVSSPLTDEQRKGIADRLGRLEAMLSKFGV